MQSSHATETQTPVRSSMADDPDFAELLELFYVSLQEAKENLRNLFASNNIEQLQREAHKLKGAGGGYGFEGLTTEAADLETACKTGDVVLIAERLESLLAYASRIEV